MPNINAKGAILITGAAKRIGGEIALKLAQNHPVIIHYNHSKEDAEKLATKIIDAGNEAMLIKADLNNIKQLNGLIEKALNMSQAPIVGLINNASLFENDAPNNLDKALFDRHMNINLWAPLKLAQDFAKNLTAGHKGHIINIIDQRVLGVTKEFTSYTLSKAALWHATKTLAKELAPHIQVNAIAPGPILRSHYQTIDDFSIEVAATPLQTHANAYDIARAVLFLLENKAITGEMITLDGGQHLYS